MATGNSRRTMWIIVVAVSLAAIAALAIAGRVNPDYLVLIGAVAFAAVGAVFTWAFSTDKDGLWWAIIPGIGAFTLVAALLADTLIGTDPANDWVGGLVVGIGSSIAAAILKRADAKTVLILVAMFSFLVGFSMAPIPAIPKVLLIAAGIAVAAFFILRIRGATSPPQSA